MLYQLQNPKECKKARILTCTCDNNCGYGCQLHHILYCHFVAYKSKRTLVLNNMLTRYGGKGFDDFFQLSSSEKCQNKTANGLGRRWNWKATENEKHEKKL